MKDILIATHGVWGEDSRFPRRDWRAEVVNDDTQLGYWDWVEAKWADSHDAGLDHAIVVTVDVAHIGDRNRKIIDHAVALLREIPGVIVAGWRDEEED